MANAAIVVDKTFLILVNYWVCFVLMLMVTKVPNGWCWGFVPAIGGCACPSELERQDKREKNQENPLHRRSITHHPA